MPAVGDEIAQTLRGVIGPAHVAANPGASPTLDDVPVACLARPANADEIAAILQIANTHRWRVLVRGGGTKLDVGNPPASVEVLLSTERLAAVRWHTPRDQTISVQAGMTLAALHSHLAAEGQCLALDAPHAAHATLGGIMATDSSGPLRYGRGTLRDALIGVEFVTPTGTLAKAGGGVVKNVAGYNLMQLHTGAWGQLGVITAVNLKLRPAPVEVGVVCLTLSDGPATDSPPADVATRAEALLADVLSGPLRPVVVEGIAGPGPRRQIVLGFSEDSTDAVVWQCQQAAQLANGWGVSRVAVTVGNVAAEQLSALAETLRPRAVFRAGVASRHVCEMTERAMTLLAPAGGLWRWAMQVHLANGLFVGALVGDDGTCPPDANATLPVQAVARALAALRGELEARGGYLTLWHAPTALKAHLSVWGQPRPDWPMMARIKAELDPADILNTGRLISRDELRTCPS